MKVTRDMVHPDLRRRVWIGRALEWTLTKPSLISLQNRLTSPLEGRDIDGIACDEVRIPSRSAGPAIRARVCRPHDQGDQRLPGMMYLHGGGYMSGSPEGFLDVIRRFIETRPCVVVAPAYRLSQEDPFPAGFNDCYDTLLWMRDEAGALGLLDRRVVVAGHSAGGGMTAAVTLRNRDADDVDIAFQMPLYPMIDDRQATPSSQLLSPVWSARTNALAWRTYLRDVDRADGRVPAYAAPSRSDDMTGLPPTITFIGHLEPFRDETIAYVRALRAAGVPVAFREYPKCFHAFDLLGQGTPVADHALAFTYGSFAEFHDRYIDA